MSGLPGEPHTAEGDGPSARTIQRHFARFGLNTRPDGSAPQAFSRFEAEKPGDLWTGDALHGPVVGGRKTYLFAFIDDHSRTLVGYRWGHSEDTVRLEAALRSAPARHHHRPRQRQRQRQRQRGEPAVTIDRLRAHWNLTRMPCAKDLAPSTLHTHRSHAEGVARIG